MTKKSLKILMNIEIILVIMFAVNIVSSTDSKMIIDWLLKLLKTLNYITLPYLLLNT